MLIRRQVIDDCGEMVKGTYNIVEGDRKIQKLSILRKINDKVIQ